MLMVNLLNKKLKELVKYIIGITLVISGILAFSAYAQKVATDYIVSPTEQEEKEKKDEYSNRNFGLRKLG